MAYQLIATHEFRDWYEALTEDEQESVRRVVNLLEQAGPTLPFPQSSGIKGSRFAHMRELRIQHRGRPYRVLYAFDPIRNALLLVGGDKTGNGRWYETAIATADRLYAEHLEELEQDSSKGDEYEADKVE